MMKILQFVEPLPELILSGKKKDTWRINDTARRNIQKGDILSPQRNNGKEFAKAGVTSAIEKTFGKLTSKEKKGHGFSSDKEMYKTFSSYYPKKITPETNVKIIKFKLI